MHMLPEAIFILRLNETTYKCNSGYLIFDLFNQQNLQPGKWAGFKNVI